MPATFCHRLRLVLCAGLLLGHTTIASGAEPAPAVPATALPADADAAANANILQLQMQLRASRAREYFQQAQNLIEKDQVGPSLAYLLRAARVHPTDRTPLQRLVGLTLYRTLPSVHGQTRHAREVFDARFRPDGGAMVSVAVDGSAQFLRLEPSTTHPLLPAGSSPILALARSNREFSAGSADGTLWRWQAENGVAIGEPLKLGAAVVHLAYDPEGRQLLAGLEDGTVQLIDLATGTLGPKAALGERITALAWIGPGRWLAAAGSKLHFRAAGILAEARVPLAIGESPAVLAVSANGARVATATDRAVRVWDLAPGKLLSGPFEQPGAVQSLDFDATGQRLVVGDSSGTAMIWDAATGRSLSGPMDHLSPVVQVRFDPQGLRVATGTFRGNAAIWSARRTERLTTRMSYGGAITSLDWSPDGHFLLAGSADQTARVWDVRSGVALSQPVPTSGGLAHVGFLGDREVALVPQEPLEGAQDYQLRELLSGQPLGPAIHLEAPLAQATFSPDGERLALMWEGAQGLHLQLLATRGATPVGAPFRVAGAPGRIALQFSPDGRYVMVPIGTELMVCETETGRPVPLPLKLPAAVTAVAFSADGKMIFAGDAEGSGRLWRLPSGDPLGGVLRPPGKVLAAAFSPAGDLLITGSADATASIWSTVGGGRISAPLPHAAPVQAVRFSADGKLAATGTASGEVQWFSTKDGSAVSAPLASEAPVWELEFAPEGQWLQARVGQEPSDRQLRVWNVATQKPLALPPGALNQVAIDPREQRLVAAYAHGKAYVVSARTGKMAGNQLVHEGSIGETVFSPDGRQIATGAWDATARVWDAATRSPLSDPLPHDGPVTELRFSRDGERLITVEADSLVRCWELGPFNQPPPQWFDELITVESGFTIDAEGQLEPFLSDRIATRARIEKLITGDRTDPWVRWGQWMFADLIDSPISPNASLFVRTHLEERIAHTDTLDQLDALAVRCAGDGKLQQLIRDRQQALGESGK